MSASTFRLPDWLGGHPCDITAPGEGNNQIITMLGGPHTGETMTVDHDWLVEVRPPSIDDPEPLPLEIRHPDTKGDVWHLALVGPSPFVGDLGAASLVVATPEAKDVGILLSVDELRRLARAAWQRANAVERAS